MPDEQVVQKLGCTLHLNPHASLCLKPFHVCSPTGLFAFIYKQIHC